MYSTSMVPAIPRIIAAMMATITKVQTSSSPPAQFDGRRAGLDAEASLTFIGWFMYDCWNWMTLL